MTLKLAESRQGFWLWYQLRLRCCFAYASSLFFFFWCAECKKPLTSRYCLHRDAISIQSVNSYPPFVDFYLFLLSTPPSPVHSSPFCFFIYSFHRFFLFIHFFIPAFIPLFFPTLYLSYLSIDIISLIHVSSIVFIIQIFMNISTSLYVLITDCRIVLKFCVCDLLCLLLRLLSPFGLMYNETVFFWVYSVVNMN